MQGGPKDEGRISRLTERASSVGGFATGIFTGAKLNPSLREATSDGDESPCNWHKRNAFENEGIIDSE